HSFTYWRDALPNGLRFISDAVEGKTYRGDVKILSKPANVASAAKRVQEEKYEVLLPAEYAKTQRLYPVLYITGDFSPAVKEKISVQINTFINSGSLIPLITVFISKDVQDVTATVVSAVEK